MIKFRLYFDKDKETEWLNKQAQNGLAMTGFFAGFYSFEKCEPGEYTYQVDFGEKFFSISNDYREFMEENGIEIVQPWGYWIILRKKASEGEFELYTDVDSSIEHYTKIRNMFKVVTIIELICFLVECFAVQAEPMLIFFVILLGLIVIGCMNITLKTNKIIAELKERKGDVVDSCNDKVSPLLPCGLLLNSCALIISDSINPYIKMGIQIAAIVFMLVGIYRTKHFFKN